MDAKKDMKTRNIPVKSSSYQARMAGRQDGFNVSLNPQLGGKTKMAGAIA